MNPEVTFNLVPLKDSFNCVTQALVLQDGCIMGMLPMLAFIPENCYDIPQDGMYAALSDGRRITVKLEVTEVSDPDQYFMGGK